MKISIFAFAANNKFPIDIVHRQFKKYVKEDFEFIIFNDAYEITAENSINEITSLNNIKCVRVPQHIHTSNNPSDAYATTLNWAVRDYAVNNGCDIIMLMHTDIFPICDVLISEIIGNNIIASTTEFRIMDGKGINYLYPAITMINMNLLKDPEELDFGCEPGLDTGGRSRSFVEKYANSVKFLAAHQAWYISHALIGQPIAEYFEEDLAICRSHGLSAGWVADGLYHYMAGSQWNVNDKTEFISGHQKRMSLFLKYFY